MKKEVDQPNNGTGRKVTIGGKDVVEAQTFLPPIILDNKSLSKFIKTMKKLVFLFLFALTVISCGNTSTRENFSNVDSTAVDTTVVDSTLIDTVTINE